MLYRYFPYDGSIVCHKFHEIDSCREIIGGYLVSGALHLAVVAGFPLEVVNGYRGLVLSLVG